MQQPDSFRLVIRRGPKPNQTYEISKDITTLGRDISSDIVINDRETSRHHLRLQRTGGTVTIEDLGSTNGTFVNGARIAGKTTLQNGDMIGLGETVALAFEVQRAQHSLALDPAPASGLPSPASQLPPAEAPYAPPQKPQDPYGIADPYAPQASDATPPPAYPQNPPQIQQPAYYGQPPAGYQIPAPPQQVPGYDYDPYAAREDNGGSSQWLILGCFLCFVLAFVCIIGLGLLAIDQLNLWCEDIPILTQIVTAFGFC